MLIPDYLVSLLSVVKLPCLLCAPLVCLDMLITFVIMSKFSYIMGDWGSTQLQRNKNCKILLTVFMFCPSSYLDQPIIHSIPYAVFLWGSVLILCQEHSSYKLTKMWYNKCFFKKYFFATQLLKSGWIKSSVKLNCNQTGNWELSAVLSPRLIDVTP